MIVWLRTKNKEKAHVPWVYVRRRLAQEWGCRPWEVDEAGNDEVALELELMDMEAKHARKD